MDQENQSVAPETLQPHPQQQQPLPGQPTRAQRRRRTRRKWIVLSIIAVLLLAGAAAGYWYIALRDKPAAPSAAAETAGDATDATPTPKSLITEKPGDAAPAGTTTYTSTQQNLNLSFNYPTTWTASPKTTTASATTLITITSPSSTVTAADGSSVSGKVVVTIRAGGGQVAELVSATAAQDSVQMAYKKPTASQRQYPFLTYVHFAAGSKTAGAFEEVMITGGQQFKKADVISADNLGTIDPLITAAFYQCVTAECPTPAAPNLGISDATWKNSTLFTQTAEILASFKLN